MSETKKQRRWTQEEEELLLKLKQQENIKYKDIVHHFENRTVAQLKSKFDAMMYKERKYGNPSKVIKSKEWTRWTQEEEKLLLDNAHESWDVLEALLPNRTKKSIKHKLSHHKIVRQRSSITDEQKQYIRDNMHTITSKDIADHLNLSNVNVNRYMKSLGVKPTYAYEITNVEIEHTSIKVRLKKVLWGEDDEQ